MKRLIRTAVVLAAVLGVVAAVMPASAQVPPTSNGRVGRVWITGSDTTYFMMMDLANYYNESEGCEMVKPNYPSTSTEFTCRAVQPTGVVETENYDHDVVINYFPQGSDDGRKQLCSQTNPRPATTPIADVSRSSSAPDIGFKCDIPGIGVENPTFRFIAYAKDALAPVAWQDAGSTNPLTSLTQAQTNDIWVDCVINDWGDLAAATGNNAFLAYDPTWNGTTYTNTAPGLPGNLIVWTAIPGSGTAKTWDSFVGGNSANCIPADYKDGDNATPASCPGERVVREHVMTAVETDPCAPNEWYSIYYTGVGTWNAKPEFHADNAFLLNVDGVAPTAENIQSGTFPYSRIMYNVFRVGSVLPTVSNKALGFVGSSGFICKRLTAHSKPVGDPGPGIERLKASINYADQVVAGILDNGFVPLTSNPNVNRCQTTDFKAPDVL